MLLRRLTVHVKDQNWFAVGIDFLIVVTGVFIGLQVSNWNDHRQNQAIAQDYLVRLESDLRDEISQWQYLEDYYGTALAVTVSKRWTACDAILSRWILSFSSIFIRLARR